MGMWPFRRKSNRKQVRGGAESADIPRSEGEAMHHAPSLRNPNPGTGRRQTTEMTSSGLERRRSRKDSSRGTRKSSRESKKLQRNPEKRRAYSFSPGRNDSIQVPRDVHRQHPVPPLPENLKTSGIRSAKTEAEPIAGGRFPQPLRATTQPAMSTADWPRVPTLHKRTAQDLNRRKSKKRRKEDHEREAEIKAMVSIMPARPATDSSASGRPVKRESKKMRMGLNHGLHNPSSDISLPTAESMHSSLSSRSNESTSYKISTLDILTPRPTIRYSESPRYVPGASGFGPDGSGSDTRKRRISDRVQIPKEKLKANKRVDDLADDLDAGDLRELMERDQRRREKKRIADEIKMEKKLARRQEKQKAAEAEAARDGTPPPTNMERGVLGREVIGLGIGNSAVVTSSKRKGSDASIEGRGKRPADAYRTGSATSPANPQDHFQRSDSLATEAQSPASDREEPVLGTAQVGRVSRASISPPPSPQSHNRGASSISQMMNLNNVPSTTPLKPESVRRTSESPVRPPQSWTSFFRRRSRTPKRSSIPSSFSNTSRDSVQPRDSLTSTPLPNVAYTPVKLASGVPRRTMSKFREDLPELPLSPPESRVQSPEADEVPPIRTGFTRTGQPGVSDNADPRVRHDTPTSGYQSLDAMRLRDETPTSGHRSMETASPEPTAIMSQSLASIDSEGSWLSGRKGGSKRGSAQLTALALHDSASSLEKRYKDFSESAEELGIAEDEYFSRLTPGPEDHYRMRRQSAQSGGQPVASSDEDEVSPNSPTSAETKWGAVARHPTVIHHEPRATSRQGMLNEYMDESGSELVGESPEDLQRRSYGMGDEMTNTEPEAGVHRATSVDLGRGHVRHISAGSAKLFELKSTLAGESQKDSKRLNFG